MPPEVVVFLCTPSRARLPLAAALLLAPLAVHAQPEQKLTASDGSATSYFGNSVSISNDLALVGAYGDDNGGDLDNGSAYVFRRVGDTWVEEQKLGPGGAETFFGYSVSVSGDVAVVGAPLDDFGGEDRGAAYVYHYDGERWVLEQGLRASDASDRDFFGTSVSVSGDVVVVGADWDDDNGENSGSAYVFRRVDGAWVEEAKLTASDGGSGDEFGDQVSVSGDVVVVGAWLDDDEHLDSGAAYVYRYVGGAWIEEQKLTASEGSAGDHFGGDVSVSGDVVLVGAASDVPNGSAYVFRYGGGSWVEEQKLTASDGISSGRFGDGVSVSNDVAVVGASRTSVNGSVNGAAYVYRYADGVWIEERKLTASDGSDGDRFGGEVSASGDVVLVGSPLDDDHGFNSGSAYAYDLSTLVAVEPEVAPTTFLLHPPAPNPTADRAAVAFALDAPEAVRLALHDVLGREVAAVEAGRLGARAHRLALDVSALPAGVYVWRLAAGERVEAGRLTVAR